MIVVVIGLFFVVDSLFVCFFSLCVCYLKNKIIILILFHFIK